MKKSTLLSEKDMEAMTGERKSENEPFSLSFNIEWSCFVVMDFAGVGRAVFQHHIV